VFSEGSEIPETYGVLFVQVNKEINKISSAKIHLMDGGLATDSKFTVSESGKFKPGSKIMIKAGQSPDSLKTIFQGIVTKQGLKVSRRGAIMVVVECKHSAIKIATVRKTAIYKDKKDSEIISSLWGAVAGSKSITATATKHEAIIQYNTTNWDFILTRADVNGYVVIPEDNKLEIKAPNFSSKELLEVELGKNLLEFNGEVDAESQYKSVSGYSWDHTGQKLVEAKGSPASATLAGGWSSSKLSEITNTDPSFFPAGSKMPSTFLDKWASATLVKSALALVQGRVKFIGDAKVKLGGMIKLIGLSKKFSGKAYIGGITHTIEDGMWTTEVQMGVSNKWYHEIHDNIKSPEASGIISPIEGLTIGIVNKIHEDKDGNFRILVKLPLMKQDNNMVLARWVMPYASAEAGMFFMPETNDEVIVGFLHNDPSAPIILGSVYSKSSHKPPIQPEDKNPKKTIVTKSKLIITFDDKDKIITIETPAKNTIVLDDKAGKIEIIDNNKNKIVMESAGITVESPKDINIKCMNLNIDAKTNIKMKGAAGIAMQGAKVEVKADAAFEAKGAMVKVEGSATAELKGGATTTIKGGIVMIN
jgi:Rhs element Vgr protein